MNKTNYQDKDSAWTGLVSIFAPLIQLVVVFSASFSSVLNIQSFFLFPEALNIINFLGLFSILSLVGFYWYWRNTSIININNRKDKDGKFVYIPAEKVVFRIFKIMIPLLILFFISFVVCLIFNFYERYIWSEFFTGIIQYISYFGVLCLSGLLVYMWAHEYIKKKQTFQREDFIKNLLDTLTIHGIINPPNVKVWEISNDLNKTVRLKIDSDDWAVSCSYDGKEVYKVDKVDKVDKITS